MCVSVKSHLTSGASVLKYFHVLIGQWRSKICGVFSETAPLIQYISKAICMVGLIPAESVR